MWFWESNQNPSDPCLTPWTSESFLFKIVEFSLVNLKQTAQLPLHSSKALTTEAQKPGRKEVLTPLLQQ